MAVSSEDNKVGYLASGNATYPIPFYFESASHIKLFVDDVEKVLNTHYSVTGAGLELGGELTVIETPYTGNASVIILRDVPLTQGNSLNDGGPNAAETTEKMFDKLTHIAQQINEKAERAIKMPLSFTALNPQITGDITPGALIQVNGAGDGLEMGESTASFITTLDSKVTAAQLAETNAGTSATNSATSATNSANSATASQTSATNSANSATASASSATSAAASATAAQTAANATMWQDVIFVSSGDSPLTLNNTYSGVMLACDCSGGPIVINLPSIAVLDFALPWVVGVKKTDSSGNSVTINRNGTDTIDGGTTLVLGSASSGATLIPDTGPTPDVWTSCQFGASAGNITVDLFSGTGAQVAFTLSVDPGSENNTSVYIHGVYQQKDTYSLIGTTLTFDEAPILGTNNIQVVSGTTLSIGTPADGTVSTVKIAASAVTKEKISATSFATTAQVAAGTVTDALLSPANLLGAFASSKVSDGYQKLAGGLIVQWGVTASIGAGTFAVTFPIAFTSTALQIYLTPTNSASIVAGVPAGTATGFTLDNSGAIEARQWRWLAIGF